MAGPFALEADDSGAEGPVKGPRSQALRARPSLCPRRRENNTRLNKAHGLKSLARKGTFLLGCRGGHFYWATTLVRFCLTNPGGFSTIYTRRSPEENLTAVVQPHEPLVAALRSRERQAIAEAVREHIELSYGRYISSDGRAVKSFRDAEACRRRNRRFPEVD